MSDLAATNCGCGCEGGTSPSFNNGCNSILWIIILLCCCGNSWGNGCGNGCGGNGFGGDNCCLLVLILLLCCGGCCN